MQAVVPNESNILSARCFDLTSLIYHGGTSLSSGVLPKWDVLGKKYMIKRCSVDGYGRDLTDAVNEELVYLFCKEVGINCAKYRSVWIRYFDDELKKSIKCPAVVTNIFCGELVHYRDIRIQYGLGSVNDELIDLTDQLPVMPGLNDLFFVDYIFNQQDRHSKNLGIVGDRMSPIFDSGSCLFYNVFDDGLSDTFMRMMPRHKTFGKRLDDLLAFSLEYICPDFSFEFDENEMVAAFDRVLDTLVSEYSVKRLEFIRKFVKGRIQNAGQILVEARRCR